MIVTRLLQIFFVLDTKTSTASLRNSAHERGKRRATDKTHERFFHPDIRVRSTAAELQAGKGESIRRAIHQAQYIK